MATALILLWAILGGLWRRVFGGWLGLPRSLCVAIGAALTAAPVLLAFYSVFGWWPESAAMTVAITALVMMFFIVSCYPGGKFTDDGDVLRKYGPFALGYVAAHRWWKDEWNVGGFVDGSNSIGEIFLGASFYAALMAACLAVI